MVPRIEVLRLFMQSLAGYLLCRWHHSYVSDRSGGGTSQLLSQHNAEFSCVTVFYFVAFLARFWPENIQFDDELRIFSQSYGMVIFLHLLLFWSPLRRTCLPSRKKVVQQQWLILSLPVHLLFHSPPSSHELVLIRGWFCSFSVIFRLA